MLKDTLQKGPFHPIIRLSHVKLQSHHPSSSCLLLLHPMEAFKCNESIICNEAVLDKGTLTFIKIHLLELIQDVTSFSEKKIEIKVKSV